jgi:group II intron reverse transcriptase/maturase
MNQPINYIVEVDIKKFFDKVNHNILMELLRIRIADENLLWIIRKFLKAGVMKDGVFSETDEGVPQGGVISPILANMYLHYVLDFWVKAEFKTKGYTQLIRYADDFVMLCECEDDAKNFLEELVTRLAEFGLEISKEKTKILKFGRGPWNQAQQEGTKMATFDFLGFTHYGAASRMGWFSMRHKTIRQRMATRFVAFADWLRNIRSKLPLQDWWDKIKAKLDGHYNYYGISGNFRCINKYYQRMLWITFKWLNRRSQKKSMNWKQFMQYLKWHPLPKPRIKYALWNS